MFMILNEFVLHSLLIVLYICTKKRKFTTCTQASLALVWYIKKAVRCTAEFLWFAERKGFEPLDPFRSTVFKTAALDHSAISPLDWAAKIFNFSIPPKIYCR